MADMKILDSNIIIYSFQSAVLDKAIQLRRQYKLKLADSIVAATALLNDAELVTRNVADFKGIPNLVILNPIP